jgi:hypothetical protein
MSDELAGDGGRDGVLPELFGGRPLILRAR